MSKDTPEAGDIFYNEKLDEKIYIYKLWEDDKKGKFVKLLIKETYGLFLEALLLKDINFESMKYLGKSKANIDDLFKTENEE
ncbi:MAG: hypothetical protein IJ529_01895 [Alphaproteobacteria bacterium]|nr:hypothetical protein [Alphaproteobacteria bacterium]MBR1600037.1 hypothetical protein [Alphaproteobacteria bacterium]